MSELIKSIFVQKLLIALAALILVVGVFTAGVTVGERKFRHFSGLCESYGRMLNPRHGLGERFPFPPPMLPGTHGVFGKVLSVSDSALIIQGKDDVEQNVLITSSTMIRVDRDAVTIADLHPNMEVSVFGSPNSVGQIKASLIRIFTRP